MTNLMKDLSVTLEDRPGNLAKAMEAIAKAGLNIEGAASVPCENEGIFHVLTEDAAATRRALQSTGFKIGAEQPVLVIDVEDKPGAAAKIFRHIADANVNVNLFYVATKSRVVVGADNVQKAQEALKTPAAARR